MSSNPPDETPMPMVPLPPIATTAESWEAHAVFRETFLLYWTDLHHNEAFRAVGQALYDVTLQASGSALLPNLPDPVPRYELAAVVADLRQLEGFAGMVAEEQHDAFSDPEGARLTRIARRLVRKLRKLAAELEAALQSRN